MRILLTGIMLFSSIASHALTLEQRQIRLLERVVGQKINSSRNFSSTINGKVGTSSHNRYLGEDCSVTFKYTARTKSLSINIDAYEGENNRQKELKLSLSDVAEEKMGEWFFEQKGEPVVTQHIKINFFNFHAFVNYGTGEPIKFMSSAVTPVLGCVIDDNYQTIHKYIKL